MQLTKDPEIIKYFTRLHTACSEGHLEEVKYLIEKAHVNPEIRDNEGRTALHIASEKGHISIVEYLIEKAHVNPESRDGLGRTALQLAKNPEITKYFSKFELNNGNIHTPMHRASPTLRRVR